MLVAYSNRVLAQMSKAGLLPFVYDWEHTGGAPYYRGRMYPSVLDHLRADHRFYEGGLYWLHLDVGNHLTEFRSERGSLGEGSMQIVIDQRTGRFFADVDVFCPYQDVVNAVGHFFGEVVPGWLHL